MYNPKPFQVDDSSVAVEFMRQHSFATLVTSGPDGLQASHLPMAVHPNQDGLPTLYAHLARANPHWQHFDGAREVLAIFQGPHAYVSPALYETHPSVPTWNYQVVHAHGVATVIEDPDELRAHVLELVEQHEGARPEPWRPNLPEDFLQAMLRQIVAVRIDLRRIEAKFKLGQNRPRTDRENMAAAFEASTDTTLQALGAATRDSLA